jgi:hypothetical protein
MYGARLWPVGARLHAVCTCTRYHTCSRYNFIVQGRGVTEGARTVNASSDSDGKRDVLWAFLHVVHCNLCVQEHLIALTRTARSCTYRV